MHTTMFSTISNTFVNKAWWIKRRKVNQEKFEQSFNWQTGRKLQCRMYSIICTLIYYNTNNLPVSISYTVCVGENCFNFFRHYMHIWVSWFQIFFCIKLRFICVTLTLRFCGKHAFFLFEIKYIKFHVHNIKCFFNLLFDYPYMVMIFFYIIL